MRWWKRYGKYAGTLTYAQEKEAIQRRQDWIACQQLIDPKPERRTMYDSIKFAILCLLIVVWSVTGMSYTYYRTSQLSLEITRSCRN